MATPEKIFKAGIQRESGWLYFLRDGNIMRARMVRGGQKKKPGEKPEVVLKTDVKRESGYLYYLDGQGDISRTVMSRGGTARKKKRLSSMTQRSEPSRARDARSPSGSRAYGWGEEKVSSGKP